MEENYTPELARLMGFVGATATAIRMYSAYSGGSPSCYLGVALSPERQAVDLMFLADALHHLENVGAAIESGDRTRVSKSCGQTAEIFANYLVYQPQFGDRQAKATFDLWRGHVRLEDAIEALKRMTCKAQRSLA